MSMVEKFIIVVMHGFPREIARMTAGSDKVAEINLDD